MPADTRLQTQSQERHPNETHSSEGGGVWAEHLPKAALMSNDLFLDDANVLVPVWLGGRGDRPDFPIGRNRIFYNIPSHRAPWGDLYTRNSDSLLPRHIRCAVDSSLVVAPARASVWTFTV